MDREADGYALSAWARTQLMTTLPTSSETGAERLQSQTIFLKPWSMGP